LTRIVCILIALCSVGCGLAHPVLDRHQGFGGTPITKDLPEASQVPVHGFQVSVDTGAGETEGELLAVDRGDVWVKTRTRHKRWKVARIPRQRIRRVSLELYPSHAGWLGFWTGLGTASTASQGWYSLVMGPLWLLAGITSSLTSALGNDVDIPPERIDRLAQFARYPAGMPAPWGPLRPRPQPSPPPASRPATRPTSQPASQPASRPASQPTRDLDQGF